MSRRLTSFVLKIIAAISMLLDHAGLILYPASDALRIAGRLAFPIYAYCIAEGFRYTRNRLKYFLRIFLLGVLCQIVYTVAEGRLYLGTLITYSISILLLAAADSVKKATKGEKSGFAVLSEKLLKREMTNSFDRFFSTSVFAMLLFLVFFLTTRVTVDYGFFGVLLPVCAGLFEDRGQRLVMFSAGLLALCIHSVDFPIEWYALAALPLLFLYNGKPGRVRLKYFFYIFYPAHLVILYGISLLR